MRPWVTAWGENPWTWNPDLGDDSDEETDGSGRPGRMLVASAMSTWTDRRGCGTPESLSTAFNLPIELVHDALSERTPSCGLPEALQVWSMLQEGSAEIIEASAAFAMLPGEVIEHVTGHYWMYVERSDAGWVIGHEGGD